MNLPFPLTFILFSFRNCQNAAKLDKQLIFIKHCSPSVSSMFLFTACRLQCLAFLLFYKFQFCSFFFQRNAPLKRILNASLDCVYHCMFTRSDKMFFTIHLRAPLQVKKHPIYVAGFGYNVRRF